MWKPIILSLAFASVAVGFIVVDDIEHFDNDVNGVPLLAVGPINVLNGIYWQGMSLAERVDPENFPGVIPHSGDNFAAYGVGDVATREQGPPSMIAQYPGSETYQFDLHSFYYGCVLGLETSLLGIILSCTVTVTGKDVAGNTIIEDSFDYLSDGGLIQEQEQAVLSGFFGLHSVVFTTVSKIPLLGNLVIATVIDDVDSTLYLV